MTDKPEPTSASESNGSQTEQTSHSDQTRVEVGSSHAQIEGRELQPVDATDYVDDASASLAEYVQTKQIGFREAMEQYDLVEARYDPVHGSYVVMAERGVDAEGKQLQEVVSTRELGYSSPSPFTSWTREEHNPKLRDKLGLREYYRMRRQDGSVRGSLRQFKSSILSARWSIDPAEQTPRAKSIAEDVRDNIFEGMSRTWAMTLEDILLMCDYGYMVNELVWTDEDVPGKVTLRKLAPRHPLDIREWLYDRNGGPDGILMEPTTADPGFIDVGPIFIPIDKLAVFSFEPEAGDLSGLSLLRSAFKHWFYKDTFYKIDAIQKERHGIGVPIIKLPPGFSEGDKRLADEIGRNLRTNERAHIVLPPGWEILFAKLEGQTVDCLKSIEHHDMMIWMNVLAPFSKDSKSDVDNAEMFHRSTRYVANTVADIINKFVIRKYVDINYARNKSYPKIKAKRIGEENEQRTRSFTIRNYVGSRVLTPDEALETHVREELDLPPFDPETARPAIAPQAPRGQRPQGETGAPTPPAPGRAGPPRQQPTPPIPPGTRGNAGIDSSGG